jgi:hypothetical protein
MCKGENLLNGPSCALGFQLQENREDFGRGGGDRKYELLNKARALYALQLTTLANRNRRNKASCMPTVRSLGSFEPIGRYVWTG